MRRPRPAIIAAATALVVVLTTHVIGIVVTAPATLVLTWSHDTFEVLMHVLSIYRFVISFRDPVASKVPDGNAFRLGFYRRLCGAEPSWLRPCWVTLNGKRPANPMVFLTFAAFL